MPSSLKLVYADCFTCGARKNWAETQLAIAQANEFKVEQVPFYADGAAELINLAIKAGVNIPFFTNGKKVSKNVEDFIVKKKKTTKRRVKKDEEADES